MSELDSRIGPRKSPPSESRHVHRNKAWIRPGYNTSSPGKKSHQAHHLGPSPSRSDGEPALLSRLDQRGLDFSPNSKRTNNRNRRRHRSGRSLGNLEDSGGLILGNHRLTHSTASEAAVSRSPSPMNGVIEHADTLSPHACKEAEDPDIIPGLHLRVANDGDDPQSSGSRRLQDGPKIDLAVTGSGSHPCNRGESQDRGDLASSWPTPSLKERIAPLVKQNAHLRRVHDQHEEPDNPIVHDKTMDAIMTPTFCDRFANSVLTCQSQLAQERSNNASANKSTLNTEARVENLPPSATSKLPPVSSPSIDCTFTSGSISGKTSEPSASATQLIEKPSGDTTIATDNLAVPISTLISISIPSPNASSQSPTLNGLASPSSVMREKDSSTPRKRSRSPSSSSFTRPYKRHRSRSPLPSRRSQENGWGSRNRSSRSPPPSSHRSPPSPYTARRPSYSHGSHYSGSTHPSKSPLVSPHIPHSQWPSSKSRRSRSPHLQRPRSPPSYTQESPRHFESDAVENHRGLSDAYNRGRAPPTSEYSGGSSKKRYLTAFEREELERHKKDGGQEHQSTARDSPQVGAQGRAGNRSFTSQTSIDQHTTISPVPISATTSASRQTSHGPALSHAAGDLIEGSQINSEQHFGANGSSDGTIYHAKPDLPLESLANVEKAGAILNPDIRTRDTLVAWKPFDGVPGIWLLMNGSAKPRVSEHFFNISKEVALEWNLPRVPVEREIMTETNFRVAQTPSMISWRLECVLAESVDFVRQRLECSGTAEQLAQELGQFQNQWPSGGKLIIEVNPTQDYGQTFYSKELNSDVPSVELKHHIHEGTNLIRFIQLGDLSNFVFILWATYHTSSPHTDLHTPDLGDLQIMLQKSRLENLPEETNLPTFGAHTAHVSVTVGNKLGR